MVKHLQRFSYYYQKKFRAWVARRIPRAREVTLDQQRIFIFPSRQGFFFLVVVIAILIAAINYENNIAFALAFLLVSVMIVAILHTYSNLSGLTIRAVRALPCFAGESAEVQIVLSRASKRNYYGIRLGWNDSNTVTTDLVELRQEPLRLFVKTQHRGRLRVGRLKIETFYPLGLLRAWSYVDLDLTTVIYPKPVNAGPLPPALAMKDEGEFIEHTGTEDFYGFRDYRAGDPLKHVAWRSLAKGQALQSKQFVAHVDRRVWLDWAMLDGYAVEEKLSRLCYWTVETAKGEDEYGLRLPVLEIPPSRGPEHRNKILVALALYGIDGEQVSTQEGAW